jgi:hypothetical protein
LTYIIIMNIWYSFLVSTSICCYIPFHSCTAQTRPCPSVLPGTSITRSSTSFSHNPIQAQTDPHISPWWFVMVWVQNCPSRSHTFTKPSRLVVMRPSKLLRPNAILVMSPQCLRSIKRPCFCHDIP